MRALSNEEIGHHPTCSQLISFAEGSLSPALSLVVSAHCDMCSKCRDTVELGITNAVDEMCEGDSENRTYDGMVETIVSLPKHDVLFTDTYVKPECVHSICIEGKYFAVPRSLQRFVERRHIWRKLLGRIWYTPVHLCNKQKASFIYMEKGARFPEHSHKGTEITLVLNGQFEDGIRSYKCGDFIVLDNHHTHAPTTPQDEGCLVFSILDKPLHFTSGWARLINPFSQLFFK